MNPRRVGTIAAAATAGVLDAAGCAARAPGGDAGIALGTGQEEYEALPPDGGTLELVFGPQGGFHVWGRVRLEGLAPDVDVAYAARLEDSGRVLYAGAPVHLWIADGVARGLADLGAGRYATRVEQVTLAVRCAAEVVGRTLRVETRVVERATGRELRDARVVRVADQVPSPDCVPGRDQ